MNKKRMVYGGTIVVALVLLIMGARYYGKQSLIERINGGGEPRNQAEYDWYYSWLEEAYKNDQYGSTTPEGTLELFVRALEQEDVDLAAKYFIPEKQDQMRRDLNRGLRGGGVKALLEDFKKERKGYFLSEGEYEFDTFDERGIAEFSYNLKLNKYTQKWKIESL